MSKRLIDTGRAEYLEGKLYRYCSDQITPENYVIISRNWLLLFFWGGWGVYCLFIVEINYILI